MFYTVYSALCQKNSVSESKVAESIGLNRSAVVKWKKGASPAGPTLQRLADYFGVTTDYLLTGEDKENTPTQQGGRAVSDDDIKFALFGGDGEITDAMYDEVKRFAHMVKLREEAEKKKG